jgi:protein O-mannosyl-transferase
VRLPSRLTLVAVAAGVATLAVHWPAVGNGFIDLYDDGPYVLQNQEVLGGLSWHGLAWAVRAVHVHNWHPLTWLSHMADVSLFGLDARGHHLTSLLLHAANASLVAILFGVLGAPPLAAGLAAAFFGFHPLRLESVAWIAERKDVLSGFFALTALIAWIRYRRSGGRSLHVLALCLFGLGLLAKPMLVTLPAVILLLDAWPLRKVPMSGPDRAPTWRREAVDLAPFFALALAVSIATVASQGSTGSIVASDELPLGMRIANAATSVFAYAWKTAWPSDLSIFYPHPRQALNSPVALVALAGLAAITAGGVGLARRAPWLLLGWLWYLAMLLPVLGLIQAGRQGMADRYTYLPTLGLLLAVTWTLVALSRRLDRAWVTSIMACAGAAACVALAVATREGVGAWRDSETLFLHAVRATGPNSIASNSLGTIAGRRGDLARAAAHFRDAIAADPLNGIPRQNLAALLIVLGQFDESRFQAAEAVRLDPSNALSHYILGLGLEQQGRLPEAAAAYEAALRIRPDLVKAQVRLGEVRSAMGLPPRGTGGAHP